MLTHTSNYKRLLAFAFFVLSGTSFADTSSVDCVFSPHLVCSDNNKIHWSDSRFTDARPITIDKNHLYISHNNSAFSFNIVSGKTLWQVSAKADVRYFFPVVDSSIIDSPINNSSYVYLARSDGVLEKRLAKSGKIIWSKLLGKGWVYPPVILKGKIVTGGQDRKIWMLDNQTGNVQTTITLNQELVAPLTLADNHIIASTFDSQLSAYQLGSHKPVWQTAISAPGFITKIQSDDLIITSDMGGSISAVENKTGKIRWQIKLHNNAQFWNTLHQQKLYSLSESGKLNILDANSGKLQHSLQFDGQFAQPPIVQGELLALYNTSGSVQRIPFDSLDKSQLAVSFLKKRNSQ